MRFKEYRGLRILLLALGVGYSATVLLTPHDSATWMLVGIGIVVAIAIIGLVLASCLGRHGYRYFLPSLLLVLFAPYSITAFAIAFLPPLAIAFLPPAVHASRPATRRAASAPAMEYGDVRCAKCGTVYRVTLTFLDPKEVKVAHCRVCPANHVFAVCGRCADLEQVKNGPCSACGARYQWEVQGMAPVG